MRLVGTKGTSQPIELKTSINHADKFERKHSDVFIFPDQVNLGEIRQVQIWHDNSGKKFNLFAQETIRQFFFETILGKGPAWHLSNVTVHNAASNMVYDFRCGRWLGQEYDDGQICRVLNCTGKREKTPKHYRMQENQWQQSQQAGVQPQQPYQYQAIPQSGQQNQFVVYPKEAVELQCGRWGYPYGYGGYGGYGYGYGYPMYGGYGGYPMYGGVYPMYGGYGYGGCWPMMGGWGGFSWSWSW